MKQFKIVLGFELKNYFTNKIFMGITVFLTLAIAVTMCFPRLSALLPDDSDKELPVPVMLISVDDKNLSQGLLNSFKEIFDDYDVKLSDGGKAEIKKQISSQDAECGFVIQGLTSYTYLVNDLSLYDGNTSKADEILRTAYTANEMTAAGISADRAQKILTATVNHQTESLGKNQFQNFFYTYIMIFALYMVILLYGQMVATNVASEKSSRAMELLITGANPVSMMFGKVIASCLAGLFQIVCIFGSSVLFFNLNKSAWSGNQIVNSVFDMPLDILGYMLIFFVLGFFIYAFMYGAVGSTVSKSEDINTAVMPITMLFVISFFVVIFSISSGKTDNILLVVCSYIPFTSPMAMFTRIAMSNVPLYEILISIAILLAAVFGVGVLAAKIYRVGVLLYGTKPKLGSVIKSIFKA